MSEVKFDLKPITEKPSRRYRKGSKYDPIFERFMKGTAKLVEVSIEKGYQFYSIISQISLK